MEDEHRRQQATTTTSRTSPLPPQPSVPIHPERRADMGRFQSSADDVASPSAEAGHDPAPTRHEPETDVERVVEKGKYEAAAPFRPPRGNRFS